VLCTEGARLAKSSAAATVEISGTGGAGNLWLSVMSAIVLAAGVAGQHRTRQNLGSRAILGQPALWALVSVPGGIIGVWSPSRMCAN